MVTDTFEQMKNMLLPLGIYTVENGSAVYSELCAYAVGINLVKAQIESLKKEGFVQTAETFGLSLRENMLEITPLSTTQQRRQAIKHCLSLVRGQWIKSETDSVVQGFTFGVSIVETFASSRLTLTFADSANATRENLSTVLKATRKTLPAQLEVFSNIAQQSFDTMDAGNKSWVYLDKQSLSFNSVEG